MATIKWLGGTSTASSTAANWKGGVIPTAGDVALFDNEGLADCAWTLTGGSPVTVDEIVIESTFDHQVILNAQPTIKGLFLNGTLNAGSTGAISFKHGSAPNYFGTYKSYAERFILIGDNAAYVGSNTFSLVGSSSPITKFDDGQHPTVRIQTGKFAPDYVAPTGTSKKASFTNMIIAGGDFAPDGAYTDNDRLKVFSFTSFDATAVNSINFGLSTAEFTASSGGVVLPTYNATGYSSSFQAYYRKIVLNATTAGHKILLADNTFISVEEFEIGDGVILVGPQTLDAQGSEIRSIVVPKIRGTWSYSQISPGIYRSPRHAAGPIDLVNGNFHITGKLTVDGLIDPTGLEFVPVSSNPGGVAANTLWLNSGDSDKLYHGSSEVGGGGGGGSGTVTSVATTAPITGGTITGTGTIGISAATTSAAGSMSSADKTKLDGIEASADVTDATNVAAAGAVMSVAPITLDTSNNRVGINEASPDYDLHVHSSHNYYSVKFEHREGQTLFNRFGHIQTQNDNSSPTDGSVLDNPVWQIGQRDGGQFDIAFGNISNQIVAASDALISFKRASNSNTGAKQIGFFGATAASQPSAQDPMAFGFNPGTATPNEQALQQSIDSIIAALQSIGLLT